MSKPSHPSAPLRLLSNYLHNLAESGTSNVVITDKALEKLRGLSGIATGQIAHRKDKATALDAIREQVKNSTKFRSMTTLGDTMVFATGTPDSRIMFIGEAPGEEEEKQRQPFVGPAGKLLTKIIETMGMSRQDVYISNIVKFRPRIDGVNQGSQNRKPSNDEIDASLPFIRDEIKIVNPELIVALGGSAMIGLLGIESSVSSARGRLHQVGDHQVMVTYHPSFLLRSGSNTDKRKLWEDMLMAMDYLKMPISEKQKNYFRPQ
jgi:DNA polymerase